MDIAITPALPAAEPQQLRGQSFGVRAVAYFIDGYLIMPVLFAVSAFLRREDATHDALGRRQKYGPSGTGFADELGVLPVRVSPDPALLRPVRIDLWGHAGQALVRPAAWSRTRFALHPAGRPDPGTMAVRGWPHPGPPRLICTCTRQTTSASATATPGRSSCGLPNFRRTSADHCGVCYWP